MRARRHRRWKQWMSRAAVVASLLAATGVAQAPGAGAHMSLSGGTIAALAPAQEMGDGQHRSGVSAMNDVSARAGMPIWAVGAGDGMGDEEEMLGTRLVPYRDETQEMPWRRPPMSGLALPTSALRPPSLPSEPITILRPRTEQRQELPPLRGTPVYVAYAFGMGPPQRSERHSGLVPNDPIDATVPDDLTAPGVGSSVPPPGSAVPEPTGALAAAVMLGWSLSRRRPGQYR